jgi:MFS family permease
VPHTSPTRKRGSTSDEPGDSSPAEACPLTWPQQRRNLILFAACTGMQYLSAPVLYVGIMQAGLCRRLGADVRTSNLPQSFYFAMTAMPALLAWLSPRVSSLKRNLTLCYGISALMMAALAVTLMSPVSDQFKLAMVVLQGGVTGAAIPAAIALLWEVVGRGSAESRRGLAMGLAFGLGPVLAVLGSLGQMALLGGDIFQIHFSGLPFPTNFSLLFAAGIPFMLLAAVFSQFFVIPPAEREPERTPLASVIGLIAGLPLMFISVVLIQAAAGVSAEEHWLRMAGYVAALGATAALIYHFRAILQQRLLLLVTVVTILVWAGNGIPSNMNLYSEEVLGNLPEKYSSVQNMLRFSFKMATGLAMGWILTRTSPRTGVLVTATIFLAAQVWGLFVTGPWYLLAFGIYGAGELVGAYAPNYIVSASRPDELRRNMAFMTLLMVPAAPLGYLFGAIVDSVKAAGWTAYGMTSVTLGFRLSFLVCALLTLCGIILAVTMLPAKPRPESAPDTAG